MNVICITTDLSAKKYWRSSRLKTRKGFEENRAICLYPQVREQVCIGFGGAFTEAAAATWLSLSGKRRNELIASYFGEKGLRYVLGRTHINSCDFSLGSYACLSGPESDPGQVIDLTRDEKYRLPMLKAAALASGGKLRLMLSPWSPPAFMKTNGSMTGGGKLKKEFMPLWAACMAQFVKKYREAGLDVSFISVQNEPDAVQTWESCLYSAAEEADFAANELSPALKKLGAADVRILVWDHNKDQLLERLQQSCADAEQAKQIAGAAFHWYSGDHFEAVALCRRLYPDKILLFSEGCVEYSRYRSMSELQNAERYAHDMIGNLNAGTNGSLDWNLLLDEKGGPNHKGNFCEAPIMRTAEGGLEKKGSYYYIGHFSRCIQPGAVKIGLSSFTDELETTAFLNPDGSIAVIVLNRHDRETDFSIRLDRETYLRTGIHAHTIKSYLFLPDCGRERDPEASL